MSEVNQTARFQLADLPQRMQSKITINPATGCWEWSPVNPGGYGRAFLRTERGVERLAHRAVYWLLVGPISAGASLDHVAANGCTSTACCWPAHLEPVTMQVNLQRRTRRAGPPRQARCSRGHEFTDANTYSTPGGRRQCKECRTQHDRARRERERIAEAGTAAAADDRPAWVKVCGFDGCVITAHHVHGDPAHAEVTR